MSTHAELNADGDMVARAAHVVRSKIGDAIDIALILGSGLGGLADRIEDPISIPYRAIPGFPAASVPGHVGRFVAGTLGARRVIAAAGRYHL
jgi:Purine nucleoside phosphorylase